MWPRALPLSPPFLLPLLLHAIDLTAAAPAPQDSPTYQWQSQLGNIQEDWQKYVRAPSSTTILPVSVVSNETLGYYTQGIVTNPNGLLTAGGEPTILTRPPTTSGSAAPDVTPVIVVDFGQNIAGYLSIRFAGASNSTPGLPGIRLAFSESIQYGYLTNFSDFSRSDNGDTITPGSDQIAVQPEPYTWTDTHGCEYGTQVCADGIHGFRYLKIYLDALPADAPHTTSYGQVAIDSLSVNYTAFLGTPDTFTGWFESSDEQLNQWYYDAVYTTDLCTDILDANSTDPRNAASPGVLGKLVLLDGAKRDRLPYSGDLAVAARTSYLTRDVPQAARNVLADLADHQRADGWIPPASINNYSLALLDYPLWWVANSYDLLMYTGDTGFSDTYYQTMVNTLDNFYPSVTNPATQLITKGFGVSGSYGDYAFLPRTGAVTYFNALYVLALNNAASIATYLGHASDASRWTARAQNVSSAINALLFDPSAGAFYDGSCGSSPCATHAQDGNSLAILSGVANSTRAQSILSYMDTSMSLPYGHAFYDNDLLGTSFSQRVYAFTSYFEISARFHAHLSLSALTELRLLHSWMSSHDPGITLWEAIGPSGLPYEGSFTSLAHAWSTGIVPLCSTYILGLVPTSPGFLTFLLSPQPADLAWARGRIPTPNGNISVSWNRNAELGLFYLWFEAPLNSKAEVAVPVENASADVYVDGRIAWRGGHQLGFDAIYRDEGEGEGYVSLQIEGGTHTVTVGFSGS